MTLLALLRHGPTAANRERRLQGHLDFSLDPAGRVEVGSWRLPEFARAITWRRSPLRRCAETAGLLGLQAEPEPRLIEMDWGAWEGQLIATLRAEDSRFLVEESRGLDLSPPGGESPREIQQRLLDLFRELAEIGGDFGGVSHKGVIRTTLSLATGWDMRGRAPIRLQWNALHLFRLDRTGRPSVERLNWNLGPG